MRFITWSLKLPSMIQKTTRPFAVPDVVNFLLQMMYLALKRKKVTGPHCFSVQALDRGLWGSGWIGITIATLKTLTFLRGLDHELKKRAPRNTLAQELCIRH